MGWLVWILAFAAVLAAGPLFVLGFGNIELNQHWREADRSSSGLAPRPDEHRDAVLQLYAARAYNWRGAFAVHTWIATKPSGSPTYRVYEVTRWDLSTVYSETTAPDRVWYGNPPEVLADLRGAEAEPLIETIAEAAARYPLQHEYRVWPGPNSNTYTAWLLRQVPELGAELPPTAIGKDYLVEHRLGLAPMPSGTGYQFSVGGVFGAGIAWAEGLEITILGLVVGIDPGDRAIKLPGLGRVGFRRHGPAG